jgi:hypothetical protein
MLQTLQEKKEYKEKRAQINKVKKIHQVSNNAVVRKPCNRKSKL